MANIPIRAQGVTINEVIENRDDQVRNLSSELGVNFKDPVSQKFEIRYLKAGEKTLTVVGNTYDEAIASLSSVDRPVEEGMDPQKALEKAGYVGLITGNFNYRLPKFTTSTPARTGTGPGATESKEYPTLEEGLLR